MAKVPQQQLIGDIVRRRVAVHPSRPALVWRDLEMSYLEMDGVVDQVGTGFKRLGVKQGDRVALLLHNTREFVICYYALARLGVIAVPLNVLYNPEEVAYLIENSGAVGIITVPHYYERSLKKLRNRLPLKWIAVISGDEAQPRDTISWQDLTKELLPDPVRLRGLDAGDPILLAYTAGATGLPKGVVHSHISLLMAGVILQDLTQVNWRADMAVDDEQQSLQLSEGPYETVLLPMPLFNIFCLNVGLNCSLRMGATVVLQEHFDPKATLDLLWNHQCSIIYGTPQMFEMLVTHPAWASYNWRASNLRYAFCGGGYNRLPLWVWEEWQRGTGKPLYEHFGSVETGGILVSTANSVNTSRPIKPPAVGAPLPMTQVELRDQQGLVTPQGSLGQIVCQGPNLMLGYYDPADQSYRPLEGQMLAIGDMAYADRDDNFYIVDRWQDVIYTDQGLVFPSEIEAVLKDNPEVKDAVVLGVEVRKNGSAHDAAATPNETWQLPVAFVVLQTGVPRQSDSEYRTENMLRQYVQETLEANSRQGEGATPVDAKIPRVIFFREYLEKLPNGMAMKRAMREEAQVGFLQRWENQMKAQTARS
jgi:long-chain acyl-CoA synthetase